MVKDYVKIADQIVFKAEQENYLPSTSQLRKIFAHINKIKNKAESAFSKDDSNEIPNEIVAELQYLKIQIAYQMGRSKPKYLSKNIKEDEKLFYFFDKPIIEWSAKNKEGIIQKKEYKILNWIDMISTKEAFNMFCRYMEAIIAYQKFYGIDKRGN